MKRFFVLSVFVIITTSEFCLAEKIHQQNDNTSISQLHDYSVRNFSIYHDKAVALHLSGNYGEALENYAIALNAAYQEAALVHYGVGDIYMKQKQFDKALNEFDKAIEFDPEQYDAYQDKAVTFRLMGRFQDSVNACKQTIDLFPNMAKSHCSLGWAYEKLQRFDNAIKSHTKAISLNSNWQFPKERIQYCFSQLKDRKLVLKLLEELEKIDPSLAKKIRQDYF